MQSAIAISTETPFGGMVCFFLIDRGLRHLMGQDENIMMAETYLIMMIIQRIVMHLR